MSRSSRPGAPAEALEELRKEIERAGGQARVYVCDITEAESVDTLVKQLLTDHEGIDMLVNNAGRSIRRSIKLSYDRFHDFERTMALNYFGAVRLILGLLPHMTERRFGHIVNVSSIGVQAPAPRSPCTLCRRPRGTCSVVWSPPRPTATASPSPTSTCRSSARP